jgi:hypothetical protein
MRFLTFSLAVTLAACGGTVVPGSGSTASTGASTTGTGASTTGTGASTGTSTTGAGGGSPLGDCQTDADCGTGTCAPLTPGGYLVCLDILPPITSCTSPMSKNQCCSSADCKSGQACYSSGVLTECSGGPAVQIYNECVGDACASDADCTGGASPQICAPAGAFDHPVRACFTAYCHTSADCTAHPGGACVTVTQPCCAVPGGLACVYPGGCRKNADCGENGPCQIDPPTGTGQCLSGVVSCPT